MSGIELGRVGAWGHLDSLDAAGARGYARRVEELGYGTLWVPETVGREPFTLLGLLASETSRLVLGTSIVGIWGHDAQTTRMASLTLSEATGGRFVLGLGVSHPHLAEKLRGHRFDRPLTRMREFLAAYRAAVIRAPALEGAAEPPILVAALRARMTELAATDADGAFPYLVTPEHVAEMRRTLDAAAPGRRSLLAVTLPVVLGHGSEATAAARAYLKPYLRTPTYQATWTLQGFEPPDWEAPGSDRLLAAMVALGDVAAIRERIDGLLAAGADHVALIPLAPDGTTEHLATLEALS
ncbi:MAG TPA: LLM class flavin-dependent oxidoreductase [Patescibacteria group bacterium]|nr:LLM class flavin-dependent oxidoreductase [Patescibacteria group bacterium]